MTTSRRSDDFIFVDYAPILAPMKHNFNRDIYENIQLMRRPMIDGAERDEIDVLVEEEWRRAKDEKEISLGSIVRHRDEPESTSGIVNRDDGNDLGIIWASAPSILSKRIKMMPQYWSEMQVSKIRLDKDDPSKVICDVLHSVVKPIDKIEMTFHVKKSRT